MDLLLSLLFTYKISTISVYRYTFSKVEFTSITLCPFQESGDWNLLSLEKKITQDFSYKKTRFNVLFSDMDNIESMYLDKESKILGSKKKSQCTQQKLFFSFLENKKLLKSTLFGSVKLVVV